MPKPHHVDIKIDGLENDLIKRLLDDPRINIEKKRLEEILEPKNFIGFAPEQVVDFIKNDIHLMSFFIFLKTLGHCKFDRPSIVFALPHI